MNIFDLKVQDRNLKDVSLAQYKGKVLLIVNTAIKCGFTKTYAELEAMYEKYKGQGFIILDFPCDQFHHQAPGSDDEINTYVLLHYHTTFPRFHKIDVNGEHQSPLYAYLKKEAPFKGFPEDQEMTSVLDEILRKDDPSYFKNNDIKWNFTRFLISREGKVLKRYEPMVPDSITEQDVIKELNKK